MVLVVARGDFCIGSVRRGHKRKVKGRLRQTRYTWVTKDAHLV